MRSAAKLTWVDVPAFLFSRMPSVSLPRSMRRMRAHRLLGDLQECGHPSPEALHAQFEVALQMVWSFLLQWPCDGTSDDIPNFSSVARGNKNQKNPATII
jgi:hypothetical protein